MKKLLLLGVFLLTACNGTNTITQLNGQKVFYDFDSAVISPESKNNLLGQSLYLKKNPDINIVIEGHCDERGTSEYNLALGALRAGNSAHVLIADGVKSNRIKTISYGKEKPSQLGSGESVWKQNRNTTTILAK